MMQRLLRLTLGTYQQTTNIKAGAVIQYNSTHFIRKIGARGSGDGGGDGVGGAEIGDDDFPYNKNGRGGGEGRF